jgi:hypothetical protein
MIKDVGVGVGSPEGFSGLPGILITCPMDMAFGEMSGFAAGMSSIDMLKSRAMQSKHASSLSYFYEFPPLMEITKWTSLDSPS